MLKSDIVEAHPTIIQADKVDMLRIRQRPPRQMASLALAIDEANPFLWRYVLPENAMKVCRDDAEVLKYEAEELVDGIGFAITSTRYREYVFSRIAEVLSDAYDRLSLPFWENQLAGFVETIVREAVRDDTHCTIEQDGIGSPMTNVHTGPCISWLLDSYPNLDEGYCDRY